METSLIIAIVALVIGVAAGVFAYMQKRRIDKVLNLGATDLEKELNELKTQLADGKQNIQEIGESVKEYINLSRKSTQKVALEKYDAYDDTGGQQSFIAVFLDAENNGVLINVMHGRGATRVYGKRVNSGQTEVKLSEEEEKTLNSVIN